MSHDEGASTEVTGTLVSSKARITPGNGSRTSPEKLKPVHHKSAMYNYQDSRGLRSDERMFTENRINHMIGLSQSGGEIVNEGHIEVFELFGKALWE